MGRTASNETARRPGSAHGSALLTDSAAGMGFALKLHGLPKKATRARVQETAEMLGIADLLNRKPSQLSGGQRQRVAMGRAIVRQPQAFLMDEPLSNLDAKLRVDMKSGRWCSPMP